MLLQREYDSQCNKCKQRWYLSPIADSHFHWINIYRAYMILIHKNGTKNAHTILHEIRIRPKWFDILPIYSPPLLRVSKVIQEALYLDQTTVLGTILMLPAILPSVPLLGVTVNPKGCHRQCTPERHTQELNRIRLTSSVASCQCHQGDIMIISVVHLTSSMASSHQGEWHGLSDIIRKNFNKKKRGAIKKGIFTFILIN